MSTMDEKLLITAEKVNDALKAETIDAEMAKVLQGFISSPDMYIPVAAKIVYFRGALKYDNWSIVVNRLPEPSSNIATMKTEILNEKGVIMATGHASEVFGNSAVNSTAHIENAETSAIGRALTVLGIGVNTTVASREEMMNVDVPINSVDDIPSKPADSIPDQVVPESKTSVQVKNVNKKVSATPDRKEILKKIEFFNIKKSDWSERYVSKHYTFILRNHDDLDPKVRTAFDNLGFKVVKGIYKLRYKAEKEE